MLKEEQEVRPLRISEVERLVGVTRRNIRFYETEGLLSPGRENGNGYRDYSQAEVDTLRRIKLLRKLDLPLEEIRRLQRGELTLQDTMGRHIIQLERRRANLAEMAALCQELKAQRSQMDNLDGALWLERMEQQEKEGTRFVNIKKKDVRGKYAGAIVSALVMIILMGSVLGVMLWAFFTAPEASPPLLLVVVFCAFPAAFIVGTVIALVQRIKQIKGGEEDAAADY